MSLFALFYGSLNFLFVGKARLGVCRSNRYNLAFSVILSILLVSSVLAQQQDDQSPHVADIIGGRVVDEAIGPQDERSLALLRKAAVAGDASAQFRMGLMYQSGKGARRNAEEAIQWYRKAADQNLALAQAILSITYFLGDGVPQDTPAALRLMTKLIEKNPESSEPIVAATETILGLVNMRGVGITPNPTEGMRWLHVAAEHGSVEAQRTLGALNCHIVQGEGVNGIALDCVEGVTWLQKAAAVGDIKSIFYLGKIYYDGIGVKEDHPEALRLFKKAAEEGDAVAQEYLAAMYFQGQATPKDSISACMWLSVASSQAPEAKEDLLSVESEMNPEQIAEARRRSANWLRKHPPVGGRPALEFLR